MGRWRERARLPVVPIGLDRPDRRAARPGADAVVVQQMQRDLVGVRLERLAGGDGVTDYWDYYYCDWCDYKVKRQTYRFLGGNMVEMNDHVTELAAHLREVHPAMYWLCGEPEKKVL